MKATVLPATAKDPERIPATYDGNPKVLVLLPTAKYVELMGGQLERSFEYHLLQHPSLKEHRRVIRRLLPRCRKAHPAHRTKAHAPSHMQLATKKPSRRTAYRGNA